MPSSELEDRVWPDLAAATRFPRGGAPHPSPNRWSSIFWWGVSGVVHLLLLAAIGVLTRHISDVSQAPPLRVTVLPTMATSVEADALPQAYMPERRPLDTAQPRLPSADPDPVLTVTPLSALPELPEPERVIAPLTPEAPPPEWLDVMPEVTIAQESPPLLEPPKASAPDQWSPDAVTPVMPVPPVVAQAPAPRLASPPPVRKLPTRSPPPTTFDDPMVARLPPTDQHRREAPPAAVPGTRGQEPPPQASLPPATNARYRQNPSPSYPYEARRRGLEGTVLLLVEILESGRPERITVKQSSGHAVLDEAARGAVGRWSFIPAQREGKPIRSVAEVPIVFSLRKE
jgi:protein TonB